MGGTRSWTEWRTSKPVIFVIDIYVMYTLYIVRIRFLRRSDRDGKIPNRPPDRVFACVPSVLRYVRKPYSVRTRRSASKVIVTIQPTVVYGIAPDTKDDGKKSPSFKSCADTCSRASVVRQFSHVSSIRLSALSFYSAARTLRACFPSA